MGRLIDADELTKVMTAEWFLTMLVGTNDRYDVEEMLINCIDSVPLAYDVEKVVAELHEFSLNTEPYCNEMMREGICTEFTDCDYCKLQKAIEIVRKGGAK